ncbi:BNR repeat-containing protein [Halobacteria archaeon AArc-m2/3/4]|uniref:BNR repeat-containing protein n=1 Tax=Natronoglomus mannanivorans TaxID=2979990 RepID=A0ABT2QBM6_9EURY|nr:BNR repeat-containing protein [Halobacteria archaeon AArc-m2/3/4]
MQPVTRTHVTGDGMGNAQTNTPPFCPRLVSDGDRQWFAYWTYGGRLVVASRSLPDGTWERDETGIEIDVRDGHWTPGLGIGPDGYLFLAYNVRCSTIRWRRSIRPADSSEFGTERIGTTGDGSSATYPEFTRLRDGTLLLGYREGESGHGDWYLDRWQPETETWESLHHPLLSGTAGSSGERSTERTEATDSSCPYLWNLVQSTDGVLHAFWCWRRTPDVRTNSELSYACSPDGGETWTTSSGREYELPITQSAAEIVDPVSEGIDLLNNGWAATDPTTNAPHVAYCRNDAAGNTQLYHATLESAADGNDPAGEWRVESVTDRTTTANFGGPGVVGSPLGRMGIVVDDSSGVHILTRDLERANWPLLYSKREGTWQSQHLVDRNLAYSDIHIDLQRWRQDRVLSFVEQPQTVGDVPWAGATEISITDVDPHAVWDRTTVASSIVETDGRENIDGSPDTSLATFASTSLEDPLLVDDTAFTPIGSGLGFDELSVPATPVYARVRIDGVDGSEREGKNDAAVRAHVSLVSDGETRETVAGEPVSVTAGSKTATTDWHRIPDGFRTGRVDGAVATTSATPLWVRSATVELACPMPSVVEKQ